ncbi:thioredoxin-like protein [Tribonema minus]|uniref:Thioredoxin-like protein n=1 Tax=Tribonema minus TaxID=303371 RepID=A0A836CNH4_9STRA|nr:thioredoxin-like protein [Tribonema minus]
MRAVRSCVVACMACLLLALSQPTGASSVSKPAAISKPAAGASSGLVLRVRLPDGSVKRVDASPSDSVADVCEKIDCDYEHGVATDADFANCVEGTSSVKELKLANGAWLYLRRDPAEAGRSNAEAIMRMKKRRERELKGGGVVECLTVAKLDQEIKEAGNMLVVVDFFADWCGPCKAIAPKYKAMAEEFPKAVLLKVNVDKNKAASERYSVSSMPTFVFLKGGRVVDTLKGADEGTLRTKIKSYM